MSGWAGFRTALAWLCKVSNRQSTYKTNSYGLFSFSWQRGWTTPAEVTITPKLDRGAHDARCGAQIAQLVEQRIENPRVAGSIPALGTIALSKHVQICPNSSKYHDISVT